MKKLIVTLLMAHGLMLGQAGSGMLSGQILDERGNPIHGARVDISAVPVTRSAFRPFQASRLTEADGTFSVAAAAGRYRVCAQMARSELLNPCVWSATAPVADVQAGQRAAMKPISLRRGYPLTVRVNDGSGLLVPSAAKPKPGVIAIGVTAPNGMYHPIPLRQQNGTMREHVILVPRDTALRVLLHSKSFAVTDEKGAAVAGGGAYGFDVKFESERSQRVFVFNLAGAQQGGQ